MLEELALDYPLPKVILEYRGLAKLKSTYTDKLPLMINPKTGRVAYLYHQAVTATGRLSSTDPNPAEHSGAQKRGVVFVRHLSRRRITSSSLPTIRKLSCALWRICRVTKAC